MSGEVVHFEIPVDDVVRARKFYEKTFGWRLNEMGGLEYTLVSTGPSDANGMPAKPGHIDGGILKRQAPVKHPTITIRVDEIDAAAKAIVKNGGKVVEPKAPIGDGSIGYAAYFEDPEGNLIGLFERSSK
jgi:uncharacterized protein